MSELAERIRQRKEAEEQKKSAPPKISFTEVKFSAWLWQLGIVSIDIATAYIVWQITFLFYGILWFLAGAGGLIWSERQRQRVGNNDDQKNIGETGVTVSLVAIIVMAILAGVAYLLGYSKLGWVEVITLVSSLGLGFYHVIQARRFHILDDEFIERNEEARREAQHKRDLREIARAAREVEKEKAAEEQERLYRGKYGDAFDVAYTKKTPQQKPQERPQAPQRGPSTSYAQEGELPTLDDPKNGKGGK